MNPTALTAQLVPQQPVPAAILAARAGLEALTARLGQTLGATVLSTNAKGLTQLRLGGETLTVKLSQPLPPGTQIEVKVQLSSTGMPVLTVQSRAPVPVSAGAPLPLPPVAPYNIATSAVPQAAAAPATAVPPTVGAQPSSTQPVTVITAVQAPLAGSGTVQPAGPAPVQTVAANPKPLPQAPATAPAPSPVATLRATPTVTTATPTTMPGTGNTVAPQSPPPGGGAIVSSAGVAAPTPAATPGSTTVVTPAAAPMHGTPAPASPGPQIPVTPGQPPQAAAAPTGAASIAVGQGSGAAQPATANAQIATAATSPATVMATNPASGMPSNAALPAPTTAPPASPAPAAMPPGQRASPITGAAPRLAPATGGVATVPPARPAMVPQLSLTQPAQAAARQDSIAPLLQNLGALQGRLSTLPPLVAEAATRLLGSRLSLDKGGPGAAALKAAVARSGVFLASPARAGAPAQADVRAALLQLRAGLLGMLEGGAIAPVAPVTRRPPPPMRDAQPRALRADAPTLPETATPRDAARALLHQTDGALSRLKLVQMASQPQDAARAAALPTSDFIVELPMMLGHELSMAQLQVQRDGQGKDKRGERGWRVRFAVSFSVIGEVGAQISMLGTTASVSLWAAEDATAKALEEMLPELAPALEAKGIEVGSLRIRRGVPQAENATPAGRLMDQLG